MEHYTKHDKDLMLSHSLTWNFFTTAKVINILDFLAATLKKDFLCFFLSVLIQNLEADGSSPYAGQREICAISLHTPTASSRLHYLDYSESAVNLTAQTTRLHMQDRTHSWGLSEWALRWWEIICWTVHWNAWYNQEQEKKKGALTRSSFCHLNGCDPQGPDITLQNTQGDRVSFHLSYALTIKHSHTKTVLLLPCNHRWSQGSRHTR